MRLVNEEARVPPVGPRPWPVDDMAGPGCSLLRRSAAEIHRRRPKGPGQRNSERRQSTGKIDNNTVDSVLLRSSAYVDTTQAVVEPGLHGNDLIAGGEKVDGSDSSWMRVRCTVVSVQQLP